MSKEDPKPETTPRKCMCCQREFPSEGAHNRLCPRCKGDKTMTPWEVVTGESRRSGMR